MKRYKKANEGVHAPEDLKKQAAQPSPGPQRRAQWMGAVAAVLAVAIVGGVVLWPGRGMRNLANTPEDDPHWGIMPSDSGNDEPSRGSAPPAGGGSHRAHALAAAAGWEPALQPQYEDFQNADGSTDFDAYWEASDAWRNAARNLRARLDANTSIDGFVTASTTQVLTGAGEKNRVYSPLNLYMALAMLAETAGGESRRQILDVLGTDSIEALRENAATLWQSFYEDDDMGISVMANALWLRDDMTYSQETLDTLAQSYYASSFAGEMGSAEYNQALRDWVNEQTRNMLTEQADSLFFDPAMVLGLTSTLYFKSAWSEPFNPELNTRGVFHSPDRDVEAEFMHQEIWYGNYYWGEHFSAISLGFQSSSRDYSMWLILPDEGYTVDGLLESGEAMEFLLYSKHGVYDEERGEYTGEWPNQARVRINLSLPKFDVSSDLELSGGLKALGITDVFVPGISNFDPLGASTDDSIIVSQVQHAARVMIDEEGCTAASYVNLMLYGAAPPPDEVVDFTLDRPFLFSITGESDLPLFLGVVNQPNR